MRNRERRIALLLIAAFAWLFIGSLVIFHEEHVLGKHFNLNMQAFISPKSKDKQSFTDKLLHTVKKLHDNGSSAGILTQSNFTASNRYSFDIKPKESSSFPAGDIILGNSALRAPPIA